MLLRKILVLQYHYLEIDIIKNCKKQYTSMNYITSHYITVQYNTLVTWHDVAVRYDCISKTQENKFICVRLKFGSWTLRKLRRAQASLAVLTVKIGLEVGAFSLICQMFAAFRGSWWCDFYPCFCHDKCINLGLGLFPYILLFSCNLFL